MKMVVDLAIAEADSKPERHLVAADCLRSVHSAVNMSSLSLAPSLRQVSNFLSSVLEMEALILFLFRILEVKILFCFCCNIKE